MMKQRISGLIGVVLLTLTSIGVAAPIVSAADTSTLTGIVTAQGSPVTGATVRLMLPGTQTTVVQTTSDLTGNYVLTAETATYDVVAFSSNGLSQRVANLSLAVGANSLNLILQALTVTVSGVVIDPFGQPFANKWIYVYCTSNGSSAGGQTTAAGSYNFSMLPGSNCSMRLDGAATFGNRSMSLTYSTFEMPDLLADTTFNLTVNPPQADLNINVINADDTPANVTSINLRQSNPQGTLPSGVHYRLPGWSPTVTGTSTTTLPYLTDQTPTSVTIEAQVLIGGTQRTLTQTIDPTTTGNNLTMTVPQPLTVSGVVIDPFGQTFANKWIYVYCSSNGSSAGGQTTAAGSYSFSMLPGSNCSMRLDGTATFGNRSTPLSYSTFEMPNVLGDTTFDLTVNPPQADLNINILNADATPANVTSINLRQSNPQGTLPSGLHYQLPSWYQTITGTSTTTLPYLTDQTTTSVTIEAQVIIGGAQRTLTQTIDPTTTGNNLTMTVPQPLTVSGVVIDPFGQPFANKWIYVYCSSNGSSAGGQTTAAGSYSFSMLPGSNCALRLDGAATFGNRSMSLTYSTFEMPDLLADTTFNLTINPPHADLNINVINADGTPANVTSIELRQYNPEGTLPSGVHYRLPGWSPTVTGTSTTAIPYLTDQPTATVNISAQVIIDGINRYLYQTIDPTATGSDITLWLTSPSPVWLNGTPTSSNDGDSVSDVVESLAPNQGDGNNDGTKDYEQANVTSYPSSSNNYVTLAAPAGTELTNVLTVDPTTYSPPAGYTLPEGLTDFKLENVTPAADVTLKIYTSSIAGVTGYAKYRNGVWTLLPADRVTIVPALNQTPAYVEIRLTDGGVGDDDLEENGEILDPGGLVIVENIYEFGGFREPITPNVVNTVKAGSTVPVKWRITDADGNPVSDPASFVDLVAAVTTCATGLAEDAIETTSTNTGLQYLGNGVWQFNWKTPKTSTGCRQLQLTLADGSVHTAAIALK